MIRQALQILLLAGAVLAVRTALRLYREWPPSYKDDALLWGEDAAE